MCNGAGIDSPVVIGLVGVCLVLSPVLVPVAAVAYGAYAAASKAEDVAVKMKDASDRRRTTNLLKKVKNRYLKRLKAGEWQGYLQEVFSRTKDDPSPWNLHELGVAMLLSDDAVKAEQYLSAGLAKYEAQEEAMKDAEPTQVIKAQLHFARGLTNQTLRDYHAAIEDFTAAAALLPDVPLAEPAPPVEGRRALPNLTKAECVNSLGYSLYLRSLYAVMQSKDYVRLGTEMALEGYTQLPLPSTVAAEVAAFARSATGDLRTSMARGLLEKAVKSFDEAVALSENEPRGMFMFNRGKAKYYLALLPAMAKAQAEGEGVGPLHLAEAEQQLIQEALADFQRCVTLDNFGSAAEGHAMQGQALYLLGRTEEAAAAMQLATRLDPKTFVIDLSSPEQLLTPWPLPPLKQGDQLHDFEEKSFYGPHFCDHCLGVVYSLRPAACCRRCEFVVHRGCLDKARGLKSCWCTPATAAESAGDEVEHRSSLRRILGLTQGGEGDSSEATHVHRMAMVHFHKPTWCDACSGFVMVPWGYRCLDCRFRSHVDCLDGLGCVVVDKESET